MPIAPHPAAEAYPSIDHLLGDGRGRFFSHGYKSTSPSLHAVQLHRDGAQSTLTARAGIRVRGVWSVKGEKAQLPHLGTTDVLVLASRMAEVLLSAQGLRDLLPQSFLRSVTITGGNKPIEKGLDDLACSATARTQLGAPSSTVRCTIESMTVILEIEHGTSAPTRDLGVAPAVISSADAVALPEIDPASLYGELWSQRHVSLSNVLLDQHAGTALAQLSFLQDPPLSAGHVSTGLEAHHIHRLSALEYFVATLQLGQVLLYRLDGVDRAQSNTLWMRKTRIVLTEPTRRGPLPHAVALNSELQNSRIITRGDESWRCADVVGSFDGGEVVCSVAHQLPAVGAAVSGSQR